MNHRLINKGHDTMSSPDRRAIATMLTVNLIALKHAIEKSWCVTPNDRDMWQPVTAIIGRLQQLLWSAVADADATPFVWDMEQPLPDFDWAPDASDYRYISVYNAALTALMSATPSPKDDRTTWGHLTTDRLSSLMDPVWGHISCTIRTMERIVKMTTVLHNGAHAPCDPTADAQVRSEWHVKEKRYVCLYRRVLATVKLVWHMVFIGGPVACVEFFTQYFVDVVDLNVSTNDTPPDRAAVSLPYHITALLIAFRHAHGASANRLFYPWVLDTPSLLRNLAVPPAPASAT